MCATEVAHRSPRWSTPELGGVALRWGTSGQGHTMADRPRQVEEVGMCGTLGSMRGQVSQPVPLVGMSNTTRGKPSTPTNSSVGQPQYRPKVASYVASHTTPAQSTTRATYTK